MSTTISASASALESEAITIIREVAAEFERPVLLFSGGKDSIVLLRLAQKAFWPARVPFPVMHVDTGHNFDEVIVTRDELVAETVSGMRHDVIDEAVSKHVPEDAYPEQWDVAGLKETITRQLGLDLLQEERRVRDLCALLGPAGAG